MADWVKRATVGGNPMVSGNRVTWLWRGRSAPALVGDFNQWNARRAPKFQRVGRNLHACTLALPADAYIEYAFLRNGRRTRDPFNPRTTPNGLGDTNHFFHMPGAGPTPLARRTPSGPRGTLTRHVVDSQFLTASRQRAVALYRPPAPGPYPLLVVWDGTDYLRRAKLAAMVDNLIAHKRIRPLAMALIANGGAARGVEYGCSDLTLVFLKREILPLARKHLNLLSLRKHPGAYGVLGASMGGLMALYTGLRMPEVFGRVLSQSGAFEFPRHAAVTTELVQRGPRRPLRIWMDAGRFEWLLPINRRMARLLKSKRYAVTYHEFNAGHNYPAWRDDVANGLEELFG
jgi:enterochelin esterase family protein